MVPSAPAVAQRYRSLHIKRKQSLPNMSFEPSCVASSITEHAFYEQRASCVARPWCWPELLDLALHGTDELSNNLEVQNITVWPFRVDAGDSTRFTTWRFMGYKRGYKSAKMGYNYSYPVYNITNHEPPRTRRKLGPWAVGFPRP